MNLAIIFLIGDVVVSIAIGVVLILILFNKRKGK